MAGVTPVLPPREGCIDGKLEVKTQRYIILEELLKSLPTEKKFLDELKEKGWQFYFIEGFGTVVLEIDIAGTDYKWKAQEHPRGGFAYNLVLEFDRKLPKVGFKKIAQLDRFIVNICSTEQPRGVTVDLKSKNITFIHDSLWNREKGGLASGPREILDILQWLVEKKRFDFGMKGGMDRYTKLLALANSKKSPGVKAK